MGLRAQKTYVTPSSEVTVPSAGIEPASNA